MNANTGKVLHDLLKKGWIDRRENSASWAFYMEDEVQEDLIRLEEGLGFELERAGDRVYMIPTQDNDLFLKNNIDYRKDINAGNDVRVKDLYLMNYLAVYFIYMFFGGKGARIQTMEWITKENFIERFTKHCAQAESGDFGSDQTPNGYSDNFRKLAQAWLAKTNGKPEDVKITTRYGVLNKLLIKFEKDDLFYIRGEKIEPTRKLQDLMPYFLRKERVASIQAWLGEEEEHAADQ